MNRGRAQNVIERRTGSACDSSDLPELKPRSVKGKKKLNVRDKKKLSVKEEKKLNVRNKPEPKPRNARDEKKSSGKKKHDKSKPGIKRKPNETKKPSNSVRKPNRTHASDDTSKPNPNPRSSNSNSRRNPANGQNPTLPPPSTEHNTLAPTLPYGNLTTVQATLEWRARFLHPWPPDFYRTLQSFPAPPPIPCPTFPCCAQTNSTSSTAKILNVCDVFLRETFEALSRNELRDQRAKWHPDRFSACPEGEGGGEREAFRKMAGEVFVVVNGVFERRKKEEEEEGRKKRGGS
ncbi:hypothetical protein KC356_g8522 [Hortaea werneckii]|nr:hypothetical protein KC356_g8522 [Hortaea werneckii]